MSRSHCLKFFPNSDFGRSFFEPNDISKSFRLNFTSPATFKYAADDHYYPLPDLRLIFESSFRKWRTFAGPLSGHLDDSDLLSQLLLNIRYDHLKIFGTSIRISGNKIPCLKGELSL